MKYRVAMLLCILMVLMNYTAGVLAAEHLRSDAVTQGRPAKSTATDFVAKGVLKGTIQTTDGVSLSDGDVFFFNERIGPGPLPERYWRVPDDFTRLDGTGSFSFELPSGRYFIGAIKRKDGALIIGPPQPDDLFYAGVKTYTVMPGTENKIETIRGAKPFSRDILKSSHKKTALEGVVRNAAGQPVENMIVFAHASQSMTDRPLFVSERTDKNGSFSVRVVGNGTYYLRVRDIYGGGVPMTGSFMGAYGGGDPKGIQVRDGEVVTGIVLVGGAVLRQPAGK